MLTIHIFPNDCDMMGHVNHATMLTFLERDRWLLLEPHIAVRDYMDGRAWAVIRHVDVSYSAQVRAGDDLAIVSGLESVGKTSFVVRQRATVGARVACEARITYVAIGAKEQAPIPVPEEWKTFYPPWSESP